VTFRIAGWTPDEALAELGARIFAIARTIPILDAIRISVGFFTTDEEIETASEVVPRVIASMRTGSAAVAADPLGEGVGVS